MSHFPENLLAALEAEECILFIGSGISQWSGLPDWESLLRGMADFLDSRCLVKKAEKTEIETIIQNKDLLTAASLCSSRMRKADIREFIDGVFINSNPKPHEVHKIIVELGPDSFVTTNYDRLIEDAYQSVHGVALAPVNNDQPIEQAEIVKHGASRFIFTPHGRADNVDTIIVSLEDYRTIQYDMKSVTKSLEHLFISRPVVYLGFGLRDPDFLMIKDQIYATYSGAERAHFAVMPDVSEMMKGLWRDSYGINIVSYPTQQVGIKRSHEDFLRLLRALHEELKMRAQTVVATTPVSPSYPTVFRSAMIRFCEDIVYSFMGTKAEGVTVLASIRADLSPTGELEKMDVQHRRLPILELLEYIPSLVIIGSPGAGKTYTVQRYAGILASRALKILRPGDGSRGARTRQIIPLILPMKEYGGNIGDMITQRLPRSVDVDEGLRTGLFRSDL